MLSSLISWHFILNQSVEGWRGTRAMATKAFLFLFEEYICILTINRCIGKDYKCRGKGNGDELINASRTGRYYGALDKYINGCDSNRRSGRLL